MVELDIDGAVRLAVGIIDQAHKDARAGSLEARQFITYMQNGDSTPKGNTLQDWEGLIERTEQLSARAAAMEAKANGTPAQQAETTPATSKAAPLPLSADEIQERARRLTDLGISPQWAAVQADPQRLAEHERNERRRTLAARLGVDPRYLPEGIEND